MLNKVTGYTGFQSYGILPYPHLKPGKKTLDSNEIWEKTIRECDHMNFYENHQKLNTIYRKKHLESINPTYYENPIRMKNPDRKKDEKILMTIENVENIQSEDNKKLFNTTNLKEKILLQSGTEHWETTYNSAIVDPYSYSKSSKPLWSLHRAPYIVDSQVGPTEYMKQIGEKGIRPIDKMDFSSTKPVKIQDSLKMGSSQLTDHLPGYTGFIPAVKTHTNAYEQGLGKNERKTFLKENILENYHTRIPGYSGHQPTSAINQKIALREHCFQIK